MRGALLSAVSLVATLCSEDGNCMQSLDVDGAILLQSDAKQHAIGASDSDCKSGKCKPRATTTTIPPAKLTSFEVVKEKCVVRSLDANSVDYNHGSAANFIVTFDGHMVGEHKYNARVATLDQFKNGDLWLVNSPKVQIQGRYWTSGIDSRAGIAKLRELAITGPLLDGKILHIEFTGLIGRSGTGRILLDGAVIHKKYDDDLVALTSAHGGFAVNFKKDPDVALLVTLGVTSLELEVTLTKRSELAVSGLCGDYDANAGNDEEGMSNWKTLVAAGAEFIPHATFEFYGCGKKKAPFADKMGFMTSLQTKTNEDVLQACADACKVGTKGVETNTFSLQKSQQAQSELEGRNVDCWCGGGLRSFRAEDGNSCDREQCTLYGKAGFSFGFCQWQYV